ncbi:MAG: Rnase Y domain-containing protein, partial [Sporomusa sp.]
MSAATAIEKLLLKAEFKLGFTFNTNMIIKEVGIILEISITAIVVGLLGLSVGYWVRKNIAEAKIATAETAARKIVEDAERSGESKKKEALL